MEKSIKTLAHAIMCLTGTILGYLNGGELIGIKDKMPLIDSYLWLINIILGIIFAGCSFISIYYAYFYKGKTNK